MAGQPMSRLVATSLGPHGRMVPAMWRQGLKEVGGFPSSARRTILMSHRGRLEAGLSSYDNDVDDDLEMACEPMKDDMPNSLGPYRPMVPAMWHQGLKEIGSSPSSACRAIPTFLPRGRWRPACVMMMITIKTLLMVVVVVVMMMMTTTWGWPVSRLGAAAVVPLGPHRPMVPAMWRQGLKEVGSSPSSACRAILTSRRGRLETGLMIDDDDDDNEGDGDDDDDDSDVDDDFEMACDPIGSNCWYPWARIAPTANRSRSLALPLSPPDPLCSH
jgi:hypothetical protein